MIIPLCSMYQRHRGIHCFGQAGIASLEIFICTGRDSQLRHCLKLMPNNNLYPVRIRNWKLKILRFIRRFDQKSCFIIRVKFYQNIVASNPYIDSWISRYPFQFRNLKFLSFHSSRYFFRDSNICNFTREQRTISNWKIKEKILVLLIEYFHRSFIDHRKSRVSKYKNRSTPVEKNKW